MVKRLGNMLSLCTLLTTAACGSVYDGTYQGNPRFVLNGSILSLTDPPASFSGEVLVHIAWEMILAPRPVSTGAAGTEPEAGTPANPADPNMTTGACSTCSQSPTPPTTSGSDGSVGSVHFPAPMTLTLYDLPASDRDPAAMAVGAVVIFYDLDGDGHFSDADMIAGTAQQHRLIYTDETLSVADFASFAAQLDNGSALTKGYSLAQAQCAGGGWLDLHLVPNAVIDLVAGDLPMCP